MGGDGLLERDGETALIGRTIEGASRGIGGGILIEGRAGIGKTALIDEARAVAEPSGYLARRLEGMPAALVMAARPEEPDDEEAVEVGDALAAAGILRPERPLRFVHPIVRTAIYDEIPRAARAAAHARAARVLADHDTDPDAAAAHLLLSEPRGDFDVVQRLRTAAARALRGGAPENAARYLRRALDEGGHAYLRVDLLHELGAAEKAMPDPAAVGHLQEALDLARDPVARARIAIDLAQILVLVGAWDAMVGVVDALADLGDRDAELALRLETMSAAASAYDPSLVARLEERWSRLRDAAERGGRAGRSLLLLLAGLAAGRATAEGDLRDLVRRGLDGGRFLADEGSESLMLPQAIEALVAEDAFDAAEARAADMVADARGRGSVLGFSSSVAFEGWLGLAAALERVTRAEESSIGPEGPPGGRDRPR